jgi:hypothetical protein
MGGLTTEAAAERDRCVAVVAEIARKLRAICARAGESSPTHEARQMAIRVLLLVESRLRGDIDAAVREQSADPPASSPPA